jgi:hypothetical protein
VEVTEQLPDSNAQLAPTVRSGVLEETKATEPVGILEAFVVSVTVAVQVEVPPRRTAVGLQETAVEVLLFVTLLTVAKAFGSIAPSTSAPSRGISGSAAAPSVIKIQSFVPPTLWLAHSLLLVALGTTLTSIPVGVVETTL